MEFMIYGAGVYGEKIYETWHSDDSVSFLGYYDREKTEILGMPVHSLDSGQREIPVLISLYNAILVLDVYNDLKKRGFKNVYWYKENPYSDDFSDQIVNMNKLGDAILPQAEMHVSDCCNLNCRGCTHFSPLFKNVNADLESRIDDIKHLSKKVSHIMGFSILGGEPFLNPEIGEYVKEIRAILPNTRLVIVTNGILIPKIHKNTWKYIRENEVIVNISEYAPTQQIIKTIKQCLDAENVKYKIRKIGNSFNKPLDLGLKRKYPNKCISDGCVNIYDGKICRCPTLMYVNRFNEIFNQNLPTTGIMDIENSRNGKELIAKLREPVPLCEYCVENLVEWSRCQGRPTIEDFAEI